MIKVAITGPESSGKTTLAKALAEHFKVDWAREFARDYLEGTNGQYTLQDLDYIAEGQQKNIDALRNYELVIADTEMVVMKIWSEFKFGECSDVINSLWEKQEFDLYLLCAPDIPYEEDPLREHFEFRDELFQIYTNVLNQMKVNYIVLMGDQDTRLQRAVSAVELLLE